MVYGNLLLRSSFWVKVCFLLLQESLQRKNLLQFHGVVNKQASTRDLICVTYLDLKILYKVSQQVVKETAATGLGKSPLVTGS